MSINAKPKIQLVGMSCGVAAAPNYTAFWNNLQRAHSAVDVIPSTRWEVESVYSKERDAPNQSCSKWAACLESPYMFDAEFFKLPSAEAAYMDPLQRWLLEQTQHCIDDAGVSIAHLRSKKTAVIASAMNLEYGAKLIAEKVPVTAYFSTGNFENNLANRISHAFGFTGMSKSVNAACASALLVLEEAMLLLRVGKADYVIVLAANGLFDANRNISFAKAGMLSPTGAVNTFSITADGYVPGEGACAILLTLETEARRQGLSAYLEVCSVASNHNGHNHSLTAPSVAAQTKLIKQVYAGYDVSKIKYIEAHGTGTSLGDAVEFSALKSVFSKSDETHYIASVKPNIGHLEAGSGLISLIKAALIFKYKQLPPGLNYTDPNPLVDFKHATLKPVTTLKKNFETDYIGVSCFGFGGSNGHALLKKSNPMQKKRLCSNKPSPELFILSAHSKPALAQLIESWKAFIIGEAFAQLDYREVCATLLHRRTLYPIGVTSLVRSLSDIKAFILSLASDPKLLQPHSNQTFNLPQLNQGRHCFKATLVQLPELIKRFDSFEGFGWGMLLLLSACSALSDKQIRAFLQKKPLSNMRCHLPFSLVSGDIAFTPCTLPTERLKRYFNNMFISSETWASLAKLYAHQYTFKRLCDQYGSVLVDQSVLERAFDRGDAQYPADCVAALNAICVFAIHVMNQKWGIQNNLLSLNTAPNALLLLIRLVAVGELTFDHIYRAIFQADAGAEQQCAHIISVSHVLTSTERVIFTTPVLLDSVLVRLSDQLAAEDHWIAISTRDGERFLLQLQNTPLTRLDYRIDSLALLQDLYHAGCDIAWTKYFTKQPKRIARLPVTAFVRNRYLPFTTKKDTPVSPKCYRYLRDSVTLEPTPSLDKPVCIFPNDKVWRTFFSQHIHASDCIITPHSDGVFKGDIKDILVNYVLVYCMPVETDSAFPNLRNALVQLKSVAKASSNAPTFSLKVFVSISDNGITLDACLLMAYLNALHKEVPGCHIECFVIERSILQKPDHKQIKMLLRYQFPSQQPIFVKGQYYYQAKQPEFLVLPAVFDHPFDQTYLILGASGGFGGLIAEYLICYSNATLYLVGRRPLSELADLKKYVDSTDRVFYFQACMSDPDALCLKLEPYFKESIRIDVLLNCMIDHHYDAPMHSNDIEQSISALQHNRHLLLKAHELAMRLQAYHQIIGSVQSIQTAPGAGNYAAISMMKTHMVAQWKRAGDAVGILHLGLIGAGLSRSVTIKAVLARSGIHSLKVEETLAQCFWLMSKRESDVFISNPPELVAATRSNVSSTKLESENTLAELVTLYQQFTTHKVKPSDAIDAFDLDSMQITSLHQKICQQFARIPIMQLYKAQTISALSRYLKPNSSSVQSSPTVLEDDMAIVGMHFKLPKADTLESLWSMLSQGETAFTTLDNTRWSHAESYDPKGETPGTYYVSKAAMLEAVDEFDPTFFGLSGFEAKQIDPQERALLEEGYQALCCAGYPPSRIQTNHLKTGVFVAAGKSYYSWRQQAPQFTQATTATALWSLSNRLSYTFDLKGPSLTIDTACASSLSALHLACQSLQAGECNLALLGAANLILHPRQLSELCDLNMLSHVDIAAPFSANADGFVNGEGIVCFVLKRATDALRDHDNIYGLIKGTAVSSTGKTSGFTVPSPTAQAEVIQQALKATPHLSPAQITYVEAHGTGTKLGDPIEVQGLMDGYALNQGRPVLKIGSIKSNIGHLESAAGLAGILKVLLQFQKNTLLPSVNARPVNPHLIDLGDFIQVQTKTQSWTKDPNTIKYAGVSAFGAGGTNAHVILQSVAPHPAATPKAEPWLFVYSAKTSDALKQLLVLHKDWLERQTTIDLYQLAYTLAFARDHFEHKVAFTANTKTQLLNALSSTVSISVVSATEDKLNRLANAYLNGKKIQWSEYFVQPVPPIADLPVTVFDRQRFWTEMPSRHLSNTKAHSNEDAFVIFKASAYAYQPLLKLLPNDINLQGKTVLVTGGTGAVGMVLVRWLIERFDAKVLLVGRRALDDLPQLASLPESAVAYYRADVTQYTQLASVIEAALRHYGSIDAVFHLAGILSVEQSDTPDLVNATKHTAAQYLDELTRDLPLFCFVAYSSLSALIGFEQYEAYAKANEKLNALIRTRQRQVLAGKRTGHSVAICWPQFETTGMLVGGVADHAAFVRRIRDSQGLLPITDRQHIAALETILSDPEGGVFVPLYGCSDQLPLLLNASKQTNPTANNNIQQGVLEVIAQLTELPISKLGEDQPIGTFGLDSLRLRQLALKLNEHFHCALTPNLFFTLTTIKAISAHIGELVMENESLATQKLQTAAPEAPIAIIGVAGMLPESNSLKEFFDQLLSGAVLIHPMPPHRHHAQRSNGIPQGAFLEHVSLFDASLFNLTPNEAKCMDPQQRLLLQTTYHCIENARYAPNQLHESGMVGVFIGAQFSDYETIVLTSQLDSALRSPYVTTGISNNMLSNRLSYAFNFTGPSETIDTACSSSLVALNRAVVALRASECEMAIVGGVSLLLTDTSTELASALGILASDHRCKPFDATADGYVKGEGVISLLLKPLSSAQRDKDPIHAVILNTGTNHGGKANSLTAPNTRAQAALLETVYRKANIDSNTITYIEAHGTGTELGDPVELDALKQAFTKLQPDWEDTKEAFCAVGSVKANIGHLEPAAGLAGVLKVILAMQAGKLPGNPALNTPNAYLKLDHSPFYLCKDTQDWPVLYDDAGQAIPRRAGVSAFGFGGTNAHVILEAYTDTSSHKPVLQENAMLFVLSAKCGQALDDKIDQYINFLQQNPKIELAAMSHALIVSRDHFAHRCAWIADSVTASIERLIILKQNRREQPLSYDQSNATALVALIERANAYLAGEVIAGLPNGRKMALPAYPFQLQSYWVTSPIQTFYFKGNEFYIKDHVIENKPLLPGVYYFELIYQALGLTVQNEAPLKIVNAAWKRPMLCDAPSEVLVSQEKSGEFTDIHICSKQGDELIAHFEAAVCLLSRSEQAPVPIELTAVKGEMSGYMDHDAYYAIVDRLGHHYGNTFRKLHQIAYNDKTAVGEIRLGESESTDQTFGFHPAQLDAALGVALVFDRDLIHYQSSPIVPFALEGMICYKPLQPHCYVLVELLSEGNLAELDTRIYRFKLFNPDGQVAITIDKFVSRALKQASLPATSDQGLLQLLKRVLSKLTGVPEAALSNDESFESVGIDSLLILSLTTELEKTFGRLPRTIFFECKNMSELVDYFTENYPDEVATLSPSISEPKNKRMVEGKPTPQPKPATFKSHTATNQIAIIGLAGRFPKADSPEALWQQLIAGRDCIEEIPYNRWDYHQWYDQNKAKSGAMHSKWGGWVSDYDRFDPLFFNISPKEAEGMDPQERLFLQTAWQTFEDAGYSLDQIGEHYPNESGTAVGVFAAVMYGQYQLFAAEQMLQGQAIGTNVSYASIANRVSYFLNLHGLSMALDTACSSSLTAIHLACEHIRRGDCGLALAGGVNLTLHPNKYILLSEQKLLSTEGKCRAFGSGGDGYVPGEGVGAVLLKTLDKAIADKDYVYGVIKGSAVNHGGKVNGYTVPNPKAQAKVITQAMQQADIRPAQMDYIEAHGTGTQLGDPIELRGLSKAFGQIAPEHRCAIGSVKSNIGHLEAAAGVAGLTKILMQYKHKQLAPSIHADPLNSHIDFEKTPFLVQRTLTDWPARDGHRFAGLSSFGAGGANAHIILDDFENPPYRIQLPYIHHLITFSAKNETALVDLLQVTKLFLVSQSAIALEQIAYVRNRGRQHFDKRIAFVASDTADLIHQLSNAQLSEKAGATKLASGQSALMKQMAHLLVDAILSDNTEANVKLEKWQALAELYTNGYDLPWKTLYPGEQFAKVPLPTYQFLRKRYWLPTLDTTQQTHVSKTVLPGSNISNLNRFAFEMCFTGQEQYLQNHQIHQVPTLPAVVYIEWLYQAVIQLTEPMDGCLVIDSIQWLKPLPVQEISERVRLCFDLSGELYGFEFVRISEAKQILLARGQFHFETARDPAKIEMDTIAPSATISDVYQALSHYGLVCTGNFKTLVSLQATESVAIGTLKSTSTDGVQYYLDPGLFDGALHTVYGLVVSNQLENKMPFVPVVMAGVRLCAPLNTAATVLAKCIEPLCYELKVVDEVGRLLIQIDRYEIATFSKPHAHRIPTVPLNFQTLKWETCQLKPPQEAREPDGHVVVIANSQLPDHWVKALEADYKSLTYLVPSQTYKESAPNTFQVDFGGETELTHLLESFKTQGRVPTVCLNLLTLQDPVQTPGQLVQSVMQVVVTLMKALMNAKIRAMHYLHVYPLATRADPFNQMLSGFALSLIQENPKYCCAALGVDVALDKLVYSTVASVLRQLSPALIIHKNNQFYERRVVSLPKSDQIAFQIKPSGTYVMTGGLGGIAVILAKHLCKHYQAKLVLLGRSELNPAKLSVLSELEELPGNVLYMRCDVSDSAAMVKIRTKISEAVGQIDGVIHTAGVISDAYLFQKSWASFTDAFASKVQGTLTLLDTFATDCVPWLMCFSSISSAFGSYGLADYAAANSFMDSLAMCRDLSAAPKLLCVNWPIWDSGGMQANDDAKEMLYAQFGQPITAEQGIALFEQALIYGHANLILNTKLAGETIKTSLVKPATLNADNTELREVALHLLRGIIKKELKLSETELENTAQFDQYGLDSIMVLNVNRELETALGHISKTLLFEYNSIDALADALVEEYSEALSRLAIPRTASKKPPQELQMKPFQMPRIQPPPKLATSGGEDIAIIGLSALYADIENLDDFWSMLVSGSSTVREIPKSRWSHAQYAKLMNSPIRCHWGSFIKDYDCFDPLFFNVSPAEAELMDPQERLMLQQAWAAVEDAGYAPSSVAKTNFGVMVAVMYGHYELYSNRGEKAELHQPASSLFASIANRISYSLNVHGPSFAVDTMCSSSLTALHLACDSLRRGETDMILVGAVNLTTHPHKYVLLGSGTVLSETGACHSFSAKGDGIVPAEGVGAVILKRLEEAKADGDSIYGVIKGTAINHGGKTSGYTVPNPNAQSAVIRKALNQAHITADQISYVEAHGTGTVLGDPIEIRGLSKAYADDTDRKQYCAIGSVKSNMGHSESAAGMAGLTKILLQFQHKKLVPSLNAEALNPNIEFERSPFYVQRELRDWTSASRRIAGLSSFGAGGSNAHVVLCEYDEKRISSAALAYYPIVLSAKTKSALNRQLDNLLAWLKLHPNTNLGDLSYTLATGRDHYDFRYATIAGSITDLSQQLQVGCLGKVEQTDVTRKFNQNTRIAKLASVVEAYRRGEDVVWSDVFVGETRLRINLPTYAFDKERYWLSVKDIADAAPKAETASGDHFYQQVWERIHLKLVDDNTVQQGVMVNLGEVPIASVLPMLQMTEIQASGMDKAALGAALSAVGQFDAVYVYAPFDTISSAEGALANTKILFHLLKLLQAMQLVVLPLQFVLLTVEGCMVHTADRLAPQNAALQGFVQSMLKEYLHWRVAAVDLSLSDLAEFRIDTLNAAIVAAIDRRDVIALRLGVAYKRVINSIELPQQQTCFRKKGVYLIIGGAGGIGSTLSQYLARHYSARIVWVGRRSKDDSITAQLDLVRQLGGSAYYYCANVNDGAQLSLVVDAVLNQFGEVNGAIHSAIALADSSIFNMDQTKLSLGLDSKIMGSIHLYELLKAQPLDFFLFFSSMQSITGNAGQANYAAACRFQDLYAAQLRRQHVPAYTINWGYWGSVGAVASEAYQKTMLSEGVHGIEVDEAMPWLETVLMQPAGQYYVMKVSDSFLKQLSTPIQPDKPKKASLNGQFITDVVTSYELEWQ